MRTRIRSLTWELVVLALAISSAFAQTSDSSYSGIETLDEAIGSLVNAGDVPYREALDVVQKYASQGNVVAMRAAAAIWLYPVSDQAHRVSFTNAYFATRALIKVSPTDRIPLPDPDDF